jgi:PIN domain nuclease of toxin-antitoxin system
MTHELYILDACALIAFLNCENGAQIVLNLLEKAENNEVKILLHSINLCEIYYDCLRRNGKDKSDELLQIIEKLPLEIVHTISRELLIQTGRLKASEKISLADAFVLALSIIEKGIVISSDHKEFDIIEKKGLTGFLWIR